MKIAEDFGNKLKILPCVHVAIWIIFMYKLKNYHLNHDARSVQYQSGYLTMNIIENTALKQAQIGLEWVYQDQVGILGMINVVGPGQDWFPLSQIDRIPQTYRQIVIFRQHFSKIWVTTNQFSQLCCNNNIVLLLVFSPICLEYTAKFDFNNTGTQTSWVSGRLESVPGSEKRAGLGRRSSLNHRFFSQVLKRIVCYQQNEKRLLSNFGTASNSYSGSLFMGFR